MSLSDNNCYDDFDRYLDRNGSEIYLNPDSDITDEPGIRRHETAWDKIRNRILQKTQK